MADGPSYQSDDAQTFLICQAQLDDLLRGVREKILQRMNILRGARLLDVGCGVGTAVLEIADHVGGQGRFIGIDTTEARVAEAARRIGARNSVLFCRGDAYNLPFRDGAFTAVRIDRVLQIIDRREAVLSEMMRVCAPGGCLVASDIDLETTAIYSRNRPLTRKVSKLVSESVVYPATARELPSLLRAVGLSGVSVDVIAVQTPFELFVRRARAGLQAAIEATKITEAEADAWYEEMAALDHAGEFLQTWFYFIASGVVPDGSTRNPSLR